MRITGEATLQAPLPRVWEALLDPAVLVRTIPGCERLETVGDNAYDMTVTVGVAAIRGTYAGSCRIDDLVQHESLRLSAQGSGAPGTIDADVQVRFESNGDSTTTLFYEAETVVGGMIGGVGQRMLGSVSRRLAGEFFTAVEREVTAPAVPAQAGAGEVPAGRPVEPATDAVFTAPPRPAPVFSQRDFLTGVAVGAGLVAFGVVLGGVRNRGR